MTTDADSETDELEEPKTTRVTFHNPRVRIPKTYRRRNEEAKDHFEAALYVKDRLGDARLRMFGEFAAAVVELEEQDDPSRLLNLCNGLADEVEFVQCDTFELKQDLKQELD